MESGARMVAAAGLLGKIFRIDWAGGVPFAL